MFAKANSSSCGRSQPVAILSMGRCEGIMNLNLVISQAVIRK